jgi:ribokinase
LPGLSPLRSNGIGIIFGDKRHHKLLDNFVFYRMKSSIVIVGSSNTDMVIQADHIPRPGETILGGKFFLNPGGKGANQAVAAARLGGEVVFICKTGNDIFGKQAKEVFDREGINTRFVFSDPELPSGVALITVDKHGENSIAVASGANANLLESDLRKATELIESAAYVLMQLEIPIATIEYVASVAARKNVKVMLNPAPACILPDSLLAKINILTPNESEAEMLTGESVRDVESATRAAMRLHKKGVETVIITLGEKGALLFHNGEATLVAGIPVKAVDTTAAGDVFNGALVVALSEGKSIHEAVSFACRAAAISVTRLGAQASAPYRKELSEN